MTDPLAPLGDGHTHLSEEDRLGLIPAYIATRGELFEAEQRSIAEALLRRPPSTFTLLDDRYLRRLHQAMFDQVWEWAGQYRTRETNIGRAPGQIPLEIRNLVEDTKAWVEYGTYEPDEIAVRFHHRLVAVHAFPNGNGRHGRIAADYLITSLKGEPFSWGAYLDADTDELRTTYLQALRRADDGEIAGLLVFARA
ncbi:MAG: mobile mystery protein B [Acidimicrobiia bacterium]|jgi:Fic-DOC domain mobile mystery protein B